MCFGLTGPISGERSHLQAPRGAYFEHLFNTSSTQVLDCSNTSSCQSNSHPYPGNPGLTLDVPPWPQVHADTLPAAGTTPPMNAFNYAMHMLYESSMCYM